MKILELLGSVVTALATLSALLARLQGVWPTFARLLRHESYAYTNRLLDIAVDISDPHGSKAAVRRFQKIEFQHGDGTVIREPVWGEGDQLENYRATGARRLGIQQEGSRQVVLLGLDAKPVRGQHTTVTSSSALKDAFLQPNEYFEAAVERPTKELAMRVLFPKRRVPTNARLVVGSEERMLRRVPLRYSTDGRPLLSWRERDPKPHRTYSLRWSW